MKPYRLSISTRSTAKSGVHDTVSSIGTPIRFQVLYIEEGQRFGEHGQPAKIAGWYWCYFDHPFFEGPFPTDEGAFLNALGD